MDSAGNIVVADSENHRVQVFGADGLFFCAFGSEGSGDGEFDFPIGVVVDSAGNIIVTDTNNCWVQVF